MEGPVLGKLADSDFLQLIRVAPLVAVDVILKDAAGCVLLVQREDEPASGYFFVPGGRIFKNEPIATVFRRLMADELGLTVGFEGARLLGAFEHIYANNRFGAPGTGTHYVVLAYEKKLQRRPDLTIRHPYRWSKPDGIAAMGDVHPFAKAYFSDPPQPPKEY
jgi:colanic acid biosynthesis protein WcaH